MRASPFALLSLSLLVGCERQEASPTPEPPAEAPLAETVSTEVEEAPVTLDRALDAPIALEARARAGGPVVPVRAATRDLVLVGDRDAEAVVVADATRLTPVARIDVGGEPWQLVVAGGRAFAVLRDQSRLIAVETDGDRWARTAAVSTAAEPVALAASPDGRELYVSAAWGRSLTAYDASTLAERWSVRLPRSPRGVAVSPDGGRIFVAHASGAITSAVTLGDGEPTLTTHGYAGEDSTTGFHGRGPVPMGMCGTAMMRMRGTTVPRGGSQGFAAVAVDDEALFPAVLVHTRTGQFAGSYGSGGDFPGQEPVLVRVRSGEDDVEMRVANARFSTTEARNGFQGGHRKDGCLLPRHAAFDGPSDTVLVACVGSGQVIAHRRSGGALSTTTPARWAVPAGPVGVAVDESARAAFVWSQFDRELARIDLADLAAAPAARRVHWPEAKPVTHASLRQGDDRAPRLSAAAELGRRLFHGTGDPRLSADGRSCASCHPDGRDDGLTWPTPSGPRQTPMLAGRLGPDTAPYGWEGDAPSVAEHLQATFRRLGGKGLDGAELDGLLAYLREMETPRGRPAEAPDLRLAERGRALFFDDANVGCAVCHVGGTGSNGGRHDVGGGTEVETPSLRFVAGTAPYFHDGRFATLGDVLNGTSDSMGWAHHLGPDDRAALEAYLWTL